MRRLELRDPRMTQRQLHTAASCRSAYCRIWSVEARVERRSQLATSTVRVTCAPTDLPRVQVFRLVRPRGSMTALSQMANCAGQPSTPVQDVDRSDLHTSRCPRGRSIPAMPRTRQLDAGPTFGSAGCHDRGGRSASPGDHIEDGRRCRVFAANDRHFHGVMRKDRSARYGLKGSSQ